MKLTIDTSRRGRALADLFGIFFEDLNHAADGGLYGELIRNRDFEFDAVDNPEYTSFTAWHKLGDATYTIETDAAPFPANPHYVRVSTNAGGGIANVGYDGIPVRAGIAYHLRMWLRGTPGTTINVRLGGMTAAFEIAGEWTCYETELTASDTCRCDELALTAETQCHFDAAYVSLFPCDCVGVLRRDLAEALRDLHPRFLRFPGGCLTHDGQLDRFARDGIYNWKNTLGPVENRPGKRNSWRYHQTLGLGFYEYFLFCEQIGAQPIPVVCGGCDPHHWRFAEGEMLDRYVQDAVDLIDFAKGGADTAWGSVRAEMGHPAPFELKYLAVGNEEVHQEFFDRLPRFVEAIRAKDPSIRVIGTAGPHPSGREFERGWESARACGVDIVDEHYYQAPAWLLANMDRYDYLTEADPKVFIGEFASWGNTFENALAEAAYMTAMQNAAAVELCCYAPLLCHAKYVNWSPDMLWFDGTRLCKTVNYYVQQLFMTYQGEYALPVVSKQEDKLPPVWSRSEGAMLVRANDSTLRLTNITLTTKGQTTLLPDMTISGKDKAQLAENVGDFTLSCTMRRISGWKGMYFDFAQDGHGDGFSWCVGGWENQDSILEKRERGRATNLGQAEFSVEDDRDYELRLEKKDNRIQAWIDAQQMNDATDRPVALEKLYYAVSLKGDTVIIKAVNMRDTPCETDIEWGDCAGMCHIEVLQGDLSAENTLDAPTTVVPLQMDKPVDRCFHHCFYPHSLTVLAITPN